MIDDRRIAAVTLTGSGPAGSAVAGRAGKALKKSVLVLGGSDPFIVLDDAGLEHAVAKGVASRFMNAGQSCIAAKRFIVIDNVADEFEQCFTQAVGELQHGDPAEASTSLAPLARGDLRDVIDAQVRDAVDKGADLLQGGKVVDGPGFFYQPTVPFGPVAIILRAADEAQAVHLGNDTEFGLGASVWTADRERGLHVARQLDCGCVFVNELVKSDPRLPFGGVKASGYGRELGRQGIREFVNRKTIWLD